MHFTCCILCCKHNTPNKLFMFGKLPGFYFLKLYQLKTVSYVTSEYLQAVESRGEKCKYRNITEEA